METGLRILATDDSTFLAHETCSTAASCGRHLFSPHHSGEKISCASIIKPGLQYSHSSACLSIHSMPSPSRSSSAVPARALVQWRLAISIETLMYPSTWTASRTALWSVFSSFGTERMYGLLPTLMTENDEPKGLRVPTARRISSLVDRISLYSICPGEGQWLSSKTHSVTSCEPSMRPLMILSLTLRTSMSPPFSLLVSPQTSTTRTASSK